MPPNTPRADKDARFAQHADRALAEYLCRVGRQADIADDGDRGLRYYKAAQFIDPWSVQAVYYRATAEASEGHLDIAAELFRSMVGADVPPSYRADSLVQLGTIAMTEGKLDEARHHYTAALEIGAADAEPDVRDRIRGDALCGLGAVAQEEGDTDEALRLYLAAIEADTYAIDARVNAADVLAANGDSERAIAMLTEGVQVQPESGSLWAALGRHQQAAGRTADAEESYRQAQAFGEEQASALLEQVRQSGPRKEDA